MKVRPGYRPKKTGETVDRRQNNGSVKAVSPRHCPATSALRCAVSTAVLGQSHSVHNQPLFISLNFRAACMLACLGKIPRFRCVVLALPCFIMQPEHVTEPEPDLAISRTRASTRGWMVGP